MDFDEKVTKLTELIGAYGLSCAQSRILAPDTALIDALKDLHETYRLQMAAISTASIGYWRKGGTINPEYNCPALRDVADLYEQYNELFWHAEAGKVPHSASPSET